MGMKKTLISGVKPTGRPHIGNYFGAMKQFVDLQNDYNAHIFIADLHALTSVSDATQMKQDIVDLALDYLAIGLDPQKMVLFKQSDIPEVTELAWVFSCLTTMPYLMRAHAFKDAEAKNKEVNVGLFNYPILMAADILLPGAEIVPVGKDQKQHVEIARDIAEKFNRVFGETFKLPEAKIIEALATVPGTDGQKMSKSYKNTIPLFASDAEIKAAVMKIPTDSSGVNDPKNPDTSILFQIHSLVLNEEQKKTVRAQFEQGGIGYKDLKENCIRDISAFIAPIRERREKLAADPGNVLKILKEGGEKIRAVITPKINEIRQKIGVKLY
jgi:tryptophanyl-tRNA synthetase